MHQQSSLCMPAPSTEKGLLIPSPWPQFPDALLQAGGEQNPVQVGTYKSWALTDIQMIRVPLEETLWF